MTIRKIKPFISTYLDVSYQRYLSIKHPERFRRFQKKRLNRHLKRIVFKSPYYRSLVNKREVISLSDFPIMNKAVMMKEFDQLNTKGISLEQAKKVALQAEKNRDFAPKIGTVSVGLSSGTTGNQGVFLVSDEETVQWSAAMMNKAIDHKKFRGQAIVIAFFMRANNNLYETINQGNIHLHFFDLLHPVEENLKQLKQLKPNVIVAQPSMLRMIANFFDKESLNFSLKEVFSIAEVLEEVDKEFIERHLSCRLKEIYQATEGFLGISCHHGTLHLNEEIVYIEKEYLADDSTRFVPIITDLYRTTQPLIRYRHTDILVERMTPCPCGSSFIALEKIEGREDDCFIFGEGKEAQVIFPDFIRYAITRSSEEIRQFKCIQQTRQTIEVILELSPQALESEIIQTVKENLKALVKDVDEQKALTITINVTSLDYEQNQKLRRVISNVKGGER